MIKGGAATYGGNYYSTVSWMNQGVVRRIIHLEKIYLPQPLATHQWMKIRNRENALYQLTRTQ